MLRLAKRGQEKGVYFMTLWHPDNWAWIETVNGGRAFFMGWHNTVPMKKYCYNLQPNYSLKFKLTDGKVLRCPASGACTNYADAVVYAIQLFCGQYLESYAIPYVAMNPANPIDWKLVSKRLMKDYQFL